jgi:guanine deaminase
MDHLFGKAIVASGFHTTQRGNVEMFQNALIFIGEDGAILSVLRSDAENYNEQKSRQKAAGSLVTLPQGSYLLPGFVDLHVHAPQYPQLGSALDVPLEVWLQKYTFPLEARYADAAFARRSYRLLVDDLIANGTTTVAGQRAVIGKVAMDNAEQCPDYYRDASGGGIALDLPIGQFAPGYQFDAMVIDTTAERGTIRLWDDLDRGEAVLQKIIYTASKPNIAKVWIGGRQVL